MAVGDAFARRFFPAEKDTLVVVPPPDYEVVAAEQTPTAADGRSVAWTGRRDFPDGRPLVWASPIDGGDPGGAAGGADGGGGVTLPGPMVLGGVVVGLIGLAALAAVVFRYRARRPVGVVETPPELTDEERVLRLLEERGGRVPQAAVAGTFDWSSSKTSRLLSRLPEDGTVEKLQLGRENLIRQPKDHDA